MIRGAIRYLREEATLSSEARRERARDHRGLPSEDPGPARVIEAGVAWLGEAQDRSTSRDGGVARHFSLISGWASSYPETTGYIAQTMLDFADVYGDGRVRARALRMVDWLISIQMSTGAFQGGKIDAEPIVPVTFNTGQILLGLAAGAACDARYVAAMRRAADWLVTTLDDDGCWRRFPTPFASPGEKAYETHVAWGLLEAGGVVGSDTYVNAALANVDWALTNQRPNGWVAQCCLDDAEQPLTHTLGYFLRGVVEAYRHSRQERFLQAARLTADGLLAQLRPDGFLAGRFRSDWSAAVEWVCLTGTVQIAASWLLLYEATGDARYLEGAQVANRFVRRTVLVDGPASTRGAVKGSFPVDGDYGRFEYLNWAAKFFIDANLLEQRVLTGKRDAPEVHRRT